MAISQEELAVKPTILAAALAVLFAGTVEAATTEFIIYKDANFQGASQTVKGEVNVLEGGFASQASSLKVLGGYWYVCNQDHFAGDCRVLEAGDYPRLPAGLDNRIVSVKFLGSDPKVAQGKQVLRASDVVVAQAQPQYQQRGRRDFRSIDRSQGYREGAIELYGRPDFRGRSVLIERSQQDLADLNFDGRASSAIVREGTWQLCTEPGFEGRCRIYRPGEYQQLAELDDRVSSIRRMR